MLGWVLMMPCVLSAALASKVGNSKGPRGLGSDALRVAFLKVGFVDLRHVSRVSKDVYTLACRTLEALYGSEYRGIIHVNCSLLLRELNIFLQCVAEAGATLAAASKDLGASLSFRGIWSILAAEFGCCFHYTKGCLPKFGLSRITIDILDDARKTFVLPYALDRISHSPRWIWLWCGIADHGRADLLR